jgi:hypothetical protein
MNRLLVSSFLILVAIAASTPTVYAQSREEIKLTTIIPDQHTLRVRKGIVSTGRYRQADFPDSSIPSQSLIIDEGNVGIGTINPSTRLHINNGATAGAIRITDGTQAAGKVLTSDANGVGSWVAPTAGDFSPADIDTKGWGNSSSGSVTFPNGLIMKWGQLNIPKHYDNVLTFSPAFPTACFQVIVCEGQTGNGYDWNVGVSEITKTRAIVNSRTYSGPVRWFAIGR